MFYLSLPHILINLILIYESKIVNKFNFIFQCNFVLLFFKHGPQINNWKQNCAHTHNAHNFILDFIYYLKMALETHITKQWKWKGISITHFVRNGNFAFAAAKKKTHFLNKTRGFFSPDHKWKWKSKSDIHVLVFVRLHCIAIFQIVCP